MTARLPMVTVTGRPEQLQAGDTLDATACGLATLPTATAAGQVPAATAAGTTYAARTEYSTGTLAACPAASTALTGARYLATDEGGTGGGLMLQCTGTTWSPLAYDPPRVSLGTFSAANYLDAGTGTSKNPTGGPGTSYVLMFWAPVAVGAGAEVLIEYDGGTGGWQFGYGATADKLYVLLRGLAADATTDLGTIAVGLNCLALTVHADKSLSYSMNGAARVDIAALAGAYTVPDGSSRALVGLHYPGNAPATKTHLVAFRTYSTELSNADLVTAAAATTTPLPTVTGTVSMDLDVGRHVPIGYATAQTGPLGAVQYTYSNVGALRRTAR